MVVDTIGDKISHVDSDWSEKSCDCIMTVSVMTVSVMSHFIMQTESPTNIHVLQPLVV